jgi:hypothetical protein
VLFDVVDGATHRVEFEVGDLGVAHGSGVGGLREGQHLDAIDQRGDVSGHPRPGDGTDQRR